MRSVRGGQVGEGGHRVPVPAAAAGGHRLGDPDVLRAPDPRVAERLGRQRHGHHVVDATLELPVRRIEARVEVDDRRHQAEAHRGERTNRSTRASGIPPERPDWNWQPPRWRQLTPSLPNQLPCLARRPDPDHDRSAPARRQRSPSLAPRRVHGHRRRRRAARGGIDRGGRGPALVDARAWQGTLLDPAPRPSPTSP